MMPPPIDGSNGIDAPNGTSEMQGVKNSPALSTTYAGFFGDM
jgi:hypothetical protein